MIDSRSKGRRAEREIEIKLEENGIPCERTLGGRHQQSGDIITRTFPQLSVEVRRRKTLSIHRWCQEHEALVKGETIPVVAWRTDGDTTWRASLPLADLLWLVQAAQAGGTP